MVVIQSVENNILKYGFQRITKVTSNIGSFHLKFSAQKLISLKLGIFIAFREYTEQVGEKKIFENSKIFFSKISPLSAKINGTNF